MTLEQRALFDAPERLVQGNDGPHLADLPRTPCPRCGRAVIAAVSANTSAPHEYLEPEQAGALFIGFRSDGLPLCVRPCNALAVHRCAV